MSRSGATSLGSVIFCVLATAGAASGQSVGVGFGWQRDSGPDFPGGPGLNVQATVPLGGLFGLRASLGRSWGVDTRVGNLCNGLLPVHSGCLQEQVEHRSRITAAEAFVLARTPSLGALSLSLELGLGHYGFHVSQYGETSGDEIHPDAAIQKHRWVPAYAAEFGIHPDSWQGLGVTLGARTATVEFTGYVADGWALYGTPRLTRLSLAASYRLR